MPSSRTEMPNPKIFSFPLTLSWLFFASLHFPLGFPGLSLRPLTVASSLALRYTMPSAAKTVQFPSAGGGASTSTTTTTMTTAADNKALVESTMLYVDASVADNGAGASAGGFSWAQLQVTFCVCIGVSLCVFVGHSAIQHGPCL